MKYYVYSSKQVSVKEEAYSRMGKTYIPPEVLVNGKYKQYTEVVSDPTKMTYSDGIVVTSGNNLRTRKRK